MYAAPYEYEMIINGVLQALAGINSSVERETNEQNHEVTKKIRSLHNMNLPQP